MQNVSYQSKLPSASAAALSQQQVFAASWLLLVVASALLAAGLPSVFSIWTVIIFGVPHNYAEFRYFLAKLPSRFGPLKPFFMTSFVGVSLLFCAEAALAISVDRGWLQPPLSRSLLWCWNEALILWILALSVLRYRDITRGAIALNMILAFVTTASNCLSPPMFTVVLTYLHPLLGLWILERELRRSRKSWLPTYHRCLLAVPVVVLALALCLHGSTSDTAALRLLTLSNLGVSFFPGTSPIMFVAIYGFLQMVHYGVWVVAIPIAARSWQKWNINHLSVVRNRSRLRRLLWTAVGVATLAIPAFWLGFKFDYYTTIEIYVIVSLTHVIAEVPFLFWMHE